MKINPDRPVEELTGDNRAIVRQILGRIHCMESVLDAAHEARPKGGMRGIPVALRRGWAKCVLDTLAEYRSTYIGVVSANLSYKTTVGAFD
jgi:hypothetical protein